jgi:transcription initiation factor IIE alpha subunit
MISQQLEENERKILQTLSQHGAMSPSRVSATTWVLPNETMSLLNALNEAGMVQLRQDSHSPDGMVVTITGQARRILNREQGNWR